MFLIFAKKYKVYKKRFFILGYTTEQKCSKWPVTKCSPVQTVTTIKHTPETECKKVARQLCGPGSCIPEPGPEECFDKKETVVVEVG